MANRTPPEPSVDEPPGEEIVREVSITVSPDGTRRTTLRSVLRLPALPTHLTRHLTKVEKLLKREEADLVLVAGNLALVAFEIVEWPVAALTLAVHALARTRFKSLEAVAEVMEEVE